MVGVAFAAHTLSSFCIKLSFTPVTLPKAPVSAPARMRLEKMFAGALAATRVGHLLRQKHPIGTSAAARHATLGLCLEGGMRL